jgi:hypothetical protein
MLGFLWKGRFYNEMCDKGFSVYNQMYLFHFISYAKKGCNFSTECADYMTLKYVTTEILQAFNDQNNLNMIAITDELEERFKTNGTCGLIDATLLAVKYSIGFDEPIHKIQQRIINAYYKVGASRLQIEGRVYGPEFFKKLDDFNRSK